MKYIATIGEHQYNVEVLDNQQVSIDGKVLTVDFENVSGQPVYSLLVDGESYEAIVYNDTEGLQVFLQGNLYQVTVEDEREVRLRMAGGSTAVESGEFYLKAPMPGLVVDVPVSEGQEIAKGDILLVLESMKMQNELKSPRDGTIARVRVKVGDNVEGKQTLMDIH